MGPGPCKGHACRMMKTCPYDASERLAARYLSTGRQGFSSLACISKHPHQRPVHQSVIQAVSCEDLDDCNIRQQPHPKPYQRVLDALQDDLAPCAVLRRKRSCFPVRYSIPWFVYIPCSRDLKRQILTSDMTLASGLLWLAELIEEHSKMAKTVGMRSVYVRPGSMISLEVAY
jgi:hypothetical protein